MNSVITGRAAGKETEVFATDHRGGIDLARGDIDGGAKAMVTHQVDGAGGVRICVVEGNSHRAWGQQGLAAQRCTETLRRGGYDGRVRMVDAPPG